MRFELPECAVVLNHRSILKWVKDFQKYIKESLRPHYRVPENTQPILKSIGGWEQLLVEEVQIAYGLRVVLPQLTHCFRKMSQQRTSDVEYSIVQLQLNFPSRTKHETFGNIV